jgi:hypothetical protein
VAIVLLVEFRRQLTDRDHVAVCVREILPQMGCTNQTNHPTGGASGAVVSVRWHQAAAESMAHNRGPRADPELAQASPSLIPALDVADALVWLPGLVLAATGRYWIVGPYTLAVLPLTLVVNAILYRYQRRRVFNVLGLRVRRNSLGFIAFVLTYQMLMSPIAVVGYGQELLGLRRRWK